MPTTEADPPWVLDKCSPSKRVSSSLVSGEGGSVGISFLLSVGTQLPEVTGQGAEVMCTHMALVEEGCC